MFHCDDTSLFDQALSHPFLGEPVTKRLSSLSLFTISSSKKTTDDPTDKYDLGYRGESRASRYKAPHCSNMHEITFASSDHDDEDFSTGSFRLVSVEEGRTIDGNVAVFQERLEEINEIHQSVKYIHEIQQGERCAVW